MLRREITHLMSAGGLSADEVRAVLGRRFTAAERLERWHLDVNAGDLRRELDGYPSSDDRDWMPLCCTVMLAVLRRGDNFLSGSPKDTGAALTIRYRLPRP